MEGRSLEARRMFTTATLMCVVWLAALVLLLQQGQCTDFIGHRPGLMSSAAPGFVPGFER